MKARAAKLKGHDRFQQRREQTARDLLEAARGVLAAKGYHGTKVADVARAAGVGVGTFYLYYPTKEAIFLELVEDTVRRLKKELDTVRDREPDPLARSRRSTETFFRFAQENRELFRIVFGHEASFHDVVRRSQEMFAGDIMENIAAGMRSGAFRDGDAAIWAHAFIGMSLQVLSWWIEQEGVPLSDVTRAVTELAFHGVAAQEMDIERDPDPT
jgi:AcrR family transcriptional regulator